MWNKNFISKYVQLKSVHLILLVQYLCLYLFVCGLFLFLKSVKFWVLTELTYNFVSSVLG
jgi:hypothetical protein